MDLNEKESDEVYEEEEETEVKRKKKPLPFWLGVSLGIVIAAIIVVVFKLVTTSNTSTNTTTESTKTLSYDESKIAELKAIINRYYLYDIDTDAAEDTITDSVAEGITAALNDKYAVYYNAEEYADYLVEDSDQYCGIGVSVTWDEDTKQATVSKVSSGSPAEEAGMLMGDVIVEANGERDFEDLDSLVDVVRGEEGTTVDIVISRDGEEIPMTIERKAIDYQLVAYEVIEDTNIGYIYVDSFSTVSAEQFESAVDDLLGQGIESLIIDLRYNPGGAYNAVVSMCDRVLPEGVIFTVKDKNGTVKTETSDSENQVTIPMVVLVNENSASASELFAGALQDYGVATIVGVQTYGKGVVQSIIPMSDGSALRLTTMEYYLPDGDNIDGIGITPDVVVELPEGAIDDGYITEDEDTQLKKAIEILSE